MKLNNALVLAACWLAGTTVAADMEIRWHLGDGSTEIEHREMEERDGVSVFALARSEIVARKASSVELTPDFARAKKGDKGFWAVSNGNDWMGENDLHCRTDDELGKSVAVVKRGWDVYAQLSHLQFVFMDDHCEVSPGVWKTSYADGESVIVNYGGRPVVVDGVEVPAEGWRLVK